MVVLNRSREMNGDVFSTLCCIEPKLLDGFVLTKGASNGRKTSWLGTCPSVVQLMLARLMNMDIILGTIDFCDCNIVEAVNLVVV